MRKPSDPACARCLDPVTFDYRLGEWVHVDADAGHSCGDVIWPGDLASPKVRQRSWPVPPSRLRLREEATQAG